MADVAGVSDTGAWLVAHRGEMDRAEAAWLARLAEFDVSQGWVVDGHLTCAHWLMWHTKMARATAYEKLAVAHELRRRPVIAEAFAAGRLSYSAVRTITRIQDPERDVDVALVSLAEAGTVSDLEKVVRFYQLHAGQHRAPSLDPAARRISRRPNLDGTTTIQFTVEDSEAEEFWCIARAFAEHPTGARSSAEAGAEQPVDESAAADGKGQPVDESAAADSGREAVGESAAADSDMGPVASDRRVDAVLDMARVALAHIGDQGVAGDDRYMVHVVVRDGHPELLDGAPLPHAVAERLECDASSVVHLVGAHGEALALGRKTKQWSTAQRRAIIVRDGGRCRFPGCDYRATDVHHHQWWIRGGRTDIANGWLGCARHHTLVHAGQFVVRGEPNGTLGFYRPDGTLIGSTRPVAARLSMAA